tara:strand:- start:24092 stop:24862 length:771 start_codon:yes stop_codon:yes gene_type:complete
MQSLFKQQKDKIANIVQFTNNNKNKFELGSTNNYKSFKFFSYNRAIDNANLNKIKNSIKSRGQIMPVLITKDFTVIDGQHRVIALQELELLVHYVICNSYIPSDVEEVNNIGKKWDIRARVNNLAEHGNVNFVELKKMYDKWGETFSDGTINDAFHKTSRLSCHAIRDKTYLIDKNIGNEVLNNAKIMREIVPKATQNKFVRALKKVMLFNSNFDINTLRHKAENKKLNVYNNESEIQEEIIEVYNYRMRLDNRIH